MISPVFKLKKIGMFDMSELIKVASILNACGIDMVKKYDLHHWDNPYFKSLLIVIICGLKNDIYLLYDKSTPVASFMVKLDKEVLHFEKLGTLPSESGKGIGSYCMTQIEKIAKEKGCKKVTMEVYEPSQHAISFYKHKGYKIVGMIDTLKYKEAKMEKSI